MEILKDQEEGLYSALPQQQAFDRLQSLVSALDRIQGLPGGVLHRHVEQCQDRWEDWLQGAI
jgi:hypothetical protein